ncbi:DNA repair protein RecO [Skermanella pratensis]|uniref:DNA repair protein RecO n=1 Tax=Skermanella pratensis TaxID=2233999 RepID=UPI0013016080|nr:DNA repair protein RecO [Skermanella pratensis]
MEWTDEAIVLSARPHGEAAVVATLLTRTHGRHSGLVQGGRSSRQRGNLQPGNRVSARWRARLADHLGTFTIEPIHNNAAGMLDDPLRLAGLVSACTVTEVALPDREPHEPVFHGLAALLEAFETPLWAPAYVRWELGLLQELGFGLDLASCAATGSNDALAYVSPRTGRAVSLSAGEPYRDKLLPLPGFLAGQPGWSEAEVLAGLDLTGHFLERNALAHASAQAVAALPAARTRFIERYRKMATLPGSR